MRGDCVQFQAARRTPHCQEVRRFPWMLVCIAVVCAAAVTCTAQNGPVSKNNTLAATPVQNSGANAKESKQEKAPISPAETDRKKQIADESSQLLSMALALKAEVDKTTKDTLSLNVIRKADEIERLARTVKEKMKQ